MEQNEPQATLRESIESAIEVHSEPPVEPSAAPAEPVVEKPGRTAGRARDESGKLLPGKAVRENTQAVAKEAAPEPSPNVSSPPSAGEPPIDAPAAAPIVTRPEGCPSSWPKDLWPLWVKMNTDAPLSPQEARQLAQFNAKRETQFATGVSTYKQIADTAKPLMDAIAPFQADLEQHGIKAEEMVSRLMSAHKQLAMGSPHQKLQLFTKLAQDYGIPIQALYDPQTQQQYLAQPYVPAAAPAPQQPDIEKLIEQTLANREVQQTVASMAQNTEKYPFFNYVRADMAQLLESGEAADLNEAYEKCLELPQHAMLTTVMQKQQEQAAEQQRQAAAKATVRVARANAVSPKSSTPATAAEPTGKKGVRDSLREAIAIHAGSARV